MAANYVLIEKISVGAAGASSVTFSGIPQTGYTDLVIKASAKSERVSANNMDYFKIKFNSSATGYTDRSLYGNGSAAASETNNATSYGFDFVLNGTSGSTFSNFEMYIPNYTSANYKSWSVDAVAEENATSAIQALNANLWSNTAAITSISIESANAVNLKQYSTFYLYGVAKLGTTPAIVPYATGGDTIMTDGTYWYHTFLSSGTFTPQKAISCDYLVVAGGGGGGNATSGDGSGGGGGAGGFRTATSFSVSSGSGLTVTIGAGGAAQNNGSDSVFSTITSTGGGRGGYQAAKTGAAGGSGGGGYGDAALNAGGTATNASYGSNGGVSNTSSPYQAGGGGGKSEAGNTDGAGFGGDGDTSSYSGSSVTYAGGGAGGVGLSTAPTGGLGGGGNGGSGTTAAVAGTANTGGGGGGGSSYQTTYLAGAQGGSGIVIIRYTVA